MSFFRELNYFLRHRLILEYNLQRITRLNEMTMLKDTVHFIDAAPQSRGDAEDRRFFVLDHARRGDPSYR